MKNCQLFKILEAYSIFCILRKKKIYFFFVRVCRVRLSTHVYFEVQLTPTRMGYHLSNCSFMYFWNFEIFIIWAQCINPKLVHCPLISRLARGDETAHETKCVHNFQTLARLHLNIKTFNPTFRLDLLVNILQFRSENWITTASIDLSW